MVALSSSGETSLVLGYSSGSRARKCILRIYGGRINVASSWGWTEARNLICIRIHPGIVCKGGYRFSRNEVLSSSLKLKRSTHPALAGLTSARTSVIIIRAWAPQSRTDFRLKIISGVHRRKETMGDYQKNRKDTIFQQKLHICLRAKSRKSKRTNDSKHATGKMSGSAVASITICAYGSGSRVSPTIEGRMEKCRAARLQCRRSEHRIEHILGTITAARS
ncbi:hypothetical protein V8E53_006117 [Lactarius tabidus]